MIRVCWGRSFGCNRNFKGCGVLGCKLGVTASEFDREGLELDMAVLCLALGLLGFKPFRHFRPCGAT